MLTMGLTESGALQWVTHNHTHITPLWLSSFQCKQTAAPLFSHELLPQEYAGTRLPGVDKRQFVERIQVGAVCG